MPYTIYILNAKLTIRLICTIAVVSSILFSCDKEPDPLHFDETLILGEYNVDVSFIVDTVMYGWVPFPRPIENYSGELSIKNTDVLLTIGKNMEGYYMSFDSIYSRDSSMLIKWYILIWKNSLNLILDRMQILFIKGTRELMICLR